MGRNLSEIIYYENFPLIKQELSRGREFEGNMNCRRKNNEMITINCRIIPFCITIKYVTNPNVLYISFSLIKYYCLVLIYKF